MTAPDPLRKTKFLTAVWGKAYIERFAAVSLPSFLAPGNLPALASLTDLEVVIMTCSHDIPYFEAHSAFRKLRDVCPVRFVEIDDLVTNGIYGVTLTLAYARPIIACGEDMLNTHFVFMNADFVLADGSLRSLARHIIDDRSIVLGPSFRAIAEDMEPTLEAAVDRETDVLALGTRAMTRLALPHAHATKLAKLMGQSLCHSVQPNQFFWRVDENTMLGRYYLIFMLCLKPERVFTSVNSYCDYCFVPEMCPSGDEVAMGDSDEFFMLELQAREQEREFLRMGERPFDLITSNLGEWTTAEHRRAASHDIVFHCEDLPARIDEVRAEADAWIKRINQALPPAVTHDQHHYWVNGLLSWRVRRDIQELPSVAPEVDALPDLPARTNGAVVERPRKNRRNARILLAHARARTEKAIGNLFGYKPHVGILHPTWLEFQHLLKNLESLQAEAAGQTVQIVARKPDLFRKLVDGANSLEFVSLEEVLAGAPLKTHVFVYLERLDLDRISPFLDHVTEHPGALRACRMFFHQSVSDVTSNRNLAENLSARIGALMRWQFDDPNFEFGGGDARGRLHHFGVSIAQEFAHCGTLGRALISPFLMVSLVSSLLTNIAFQRGYVTRTHPPLCTTAVLSFRVGDSLDRGRVLADL